MSKQAKWSICILLVLVLLFVARNGVPSNLLNSIEGVKEIFGEARREQQEVEQEQASESEATVNVVQNESTPAPVQEEVVPKTSARIENVPFIQQMPELARGCEVTSLAMLLQHAGVAVGKMTLAEEIVKVPFLKNGVRGNPNDGFVGNIYTFSQHGYGVYHGPLMQLAEKYLPGRMKDLTGQGIESVYAALQSGTPVLVITNAYFKTLPESEFHTWQTSSGPVRITYREHSVTVIGYDEQYVYINDPLASAGGTRVARANFEAAWVQMGSQAITYTK